MQNKKHLDERNMEQMFDGQWIPAIPVPYIITRKRDLLLRKRTLYQCWCGEDFLNELEYYLHYRSQQMLEMNTSMARSRDLSRAKALYWRRRSFVLENGTENAINALKHVALPEMQKLADIEALIAQVTDIWQPVYEAHRKRFPGASLDGRLKDEIEITDETPGRAAKDMKSEFYSHVNSRGVTYILHARDVELRGGKKTKVYYFRKDILHDEVAQLPHDWAVQENPRNGFLTLRKK